MLVTLRGEFCVRSLVKEKLVVILLAFTLVVCAIKGIAISAFCPLDLGLRTWMLGLHALATMFPPPFIQNIYLLKKVVCLFCLVSL
jgi:hypothetical protein